MTNPLSALRQAATLPRPDTTLAPGQYLLHTRACVAIFDKYPKSTYHFLVLPRYPGTSGLPLGALDSLRTLARHDPGVVRAVLEELVEVGNEVAEMIREEMSKTEGFEWGVQIGFHAQPSMPHLHLHVMSTDLCGRALKTKRHYNSFRPDLGFFVGAADVVRWLDHGADYFRNRVDDLWGPATAALERTPLACWRCDRGIKTMDALRAHLREHFEADKARAVKGAGAGVPARAAGLS